MVIIWLSWLNCLTSPQTDDLFCNCDNRTRLTLPNGLGWWFAMEQDLKSLIELCASEIVHKEIYRGTHIRANLRKICENIEGICEPSPSSQSRLKHRNNSKGDDGNGKHEELDGQSDEHFWWRRSLCWTNWTTSGCANERYGSVWQM